MLIRTDDLDHAPGDISSALVTLEQASARLRAEDEAGRQAVLERMDRTSGMLATFIGLGQAAVLAARNRWQSRQGIAARGPVLAA